MTARALLVLAALAGVAHADTPRNLPAAIEVDRDDAPAGRLGFSFDGGEPVDGAAPPFGDAAGRGQARTGVAWGVSLRGGWVDRPIRLPAGAFGSGTPASDPVRERETVALGAALAIGDSFVLDATVRGSHQVGDRLAATGDDSHLAHLVFQDVRLGGRLRVVGDDDSAVLLRADVRLPTGDDGAFAGDKRWGASWRLIGRLGLPAGVVLAANAGIELHGAEVAVGDRVIGDALVGALGAAVPLPPAGPLGPLALTGELVGALGDDDDTLSGVSPLEARLGAIVRPLPALAIGVHVGAGLDTQIGAPRVRAVLELAWTPPADHRAPPVVPGGRDDDDDDD
jgi:hypothetical protein